MKHGFWKERWRQNEIGFHMDDRHEYLHQFFHRLHVGPETVFVPLCGKSPDLIWLRQQGAQVLGVELSELAVRAFSEENELPVRRGTKGTLPSYSSDGITLCQGDLFQLTANDLQDVRGVYDRGSLVALPAEMRQRYANFLCTVLPVDSRILLVSYDYDQSEVPGPPFSVPRDEVDRLFGHSFEMELLAERDAMPTHQLLQQRGLTALTEFACLLTHR